MCSVASLIIQDDHSVTYTQPECTSIVWNGLLTLIKTAVMHLAIDTAKGELLEMMDVEHCRSRAVGILNWWSTIQRSTAHEKAPSFDHFSLTAVPAL